MRSFISGYTKDYLQINIPMDEARKMVHNKDEEALNALAACIQNFVTWLEDCKKIDTKRRLKPPLKLGD